jgi:hypothetical protein
LLVAVICAIGVATIAVAARIAAIINAADAANPLRTPKEELFTS